MIKKIVNSDVWYYFDSLLRMYDNTFMLQMPLGDWQNYLMSIKENNFMNRELSHWRQFIFEISKSTNKKTTLRNHIDFCGNVFTFKDIAGDSYHIFCDDKVKMPVHHYKALVIHPEKEIREEYVRYLLYCDADKSTLLNCNTRLLFKEEQDESVYGMNHLGNNLFCNGLVVGFDSNGLKNCPYTEKSLKFLLECA